MNFGNTFTNSMELNNLEFFDYSHISKLQNLTKTHYMYTQSFYTQVYPISGRSYTDLSLHKSWNVVFILAVAENIKHKGF